MIKQLLNLFRRSTPLPPGLVKSAYGGHWVRTNGAQTDAGIEVDWLSAQQSATVTACVQLIADDMSGLPARICRKKKSGGRERIRGHYLDDLLNDAPNDDMTSMTWRQLTIRSLALRGASFEYLKMVGGRVGSIHHLQNWQIEPKITDAGWLVYKTVASDRPLTADQILHTLWITDDGVIGKSPIQVAADTIGVALAADRFAGKFYSQGTALTGYIKHPGQLSPEAEKELIESWTKQYSGVENASKVPALFDGSEFVPLSVSPEQAQFLQSRQYQVVDICRIFKVNPVKIGDLTKSSYATYDAVAIDHVKQCIRPFCQRLEQEWSRKLLTKEEKRDGLYITLDTEGLMRGDRQSQDKSFATGIQFGWYTRNEVRDLLDLPPIEGGDEAMTPLNMGPLGKSDAEETPSEEGPQEVQETEETKSKQPKADDASSEERKVVDTRRTDAVRLNPLLHDAVRRCLAKEVNAIKRAVARDQNLKTWAETWYEPHEDLVRSSVLPSFTAFDPATAHGRAADFATKHVARSKQDIDDALAFDAIEDLYGQWLDRRAFQADLMEDHESR